MFTEEQAAVQQQIAKEVLAKKVSWKTLGLAIWLSGKDAVAE